MRRVLHAILTALAVVPAATGAGAAEADLRAALAAAVAPCWNRAGLSAEAGAATVVLRLSVAAGGRPDLGSLVLVRAAGAGEAALAEAEAAARRAVLRCAGGGLPLEPADWPEPRDLEITFNPGGVALS